MKPRSKGIEAANSAGNCLLLGNIKCTVAFDRNIDLLPPNAGHKKFGLIEEAAFVNSRFQGYGKIVEVNVLTVNFDDNNIIGNATLFATYINLTDTCAVCVNRNDAFRIIGLVFDSSALVRGEVRGVHQSFDFPLCFKATVDRQIAWVFTDLLARDAGSGAHMEIGLVTYADGLCGAGC